MPNKEHVDILLKHGVYKWNQWRYKKPHIIPDFDRADLSEADLSGADLSGANLKKATLRRTVLTGANLKKANLSQAVLSGARLMEAHLNRANLEMVNLIRANLQGANLEKAILSGADLSGADLSRADLSRAKIKCTVLTGANLKKANLSQAVLSGARLMEADLNGANLLEAALSGADLSGANFMEAVLCGALLEGANLEGANLEGANLEKANLKKANLKKANLTEAYFDETYLNSAMLGWTILRKVDLTGVKGLDTIYHKGPSTMGIDTVRQMKGRISERFLRGCGMLPWEIEVARLYDPTITPFQISEILSVNVFQKRTEGSLFIGGIFISYSHADSKFVDKLYKRLQNSGVSVWLDRHDLVAGPLEEQIGRALSFQDIVIIVLSENSINSDWVENELEMSRNKEKEERRDVLCPISLDDSWKAKVEGDVLWRQLKRKNVIDFSAWKTKKFNRQFDRLFDGIKVYYGKRMLPQNESE